MYGAWIKPQEIVGFCLLLFLNTVYQIKV